MGEWIVGEYSKEFLEETKRVWAQYSQMPLSREDVREITESMVGLFTFLRKLQKQYLDVDAKNPLTR